MVGGTIRDLASLAGDLRIPLENEATTVGAVLARPASRRRLDRRPDGSRWQGRRHLGAGRLAFAFPLLCGRRARFDRQGSGSHGRRPGYGEHLGQSICVGKREAAGGCDMSVVCLDIIHRCSKSVRLEGPIDSQLHDGLGDLLDKGCTAAAGGQGDVCNKKLGCEEPLVEFVHVRRTFRPVVLHELGDLWEGKIGGALGDLQNIVPLAEAKGTLLAAVPGLVVSVASRPQQGGYSGHEGARLGDVVEHVAAGLRHDEVPDGSKKQVVDSTDVGNEWEQDVTVWLHITVEDSVKLGRIRTDMVVVRVARRRGRGNGFGVQVRLVSDAKRIIEVAASRRVRETGIDFIFALPRESENLTEVLFVHRSAVKTTDESEQRCTHVGDILDSNDRAKRHGLDQSGIGNVSVHVGQDQVQSQDVGGMIGTGLGQCWRTESRVSAHKFVS